MILADDDGSRSPSPLVPDLGDVGDSAFMEDVQMNFNYIMVKGA